MSNKVKRNNVSEKLNNEKVFDTENVQETVENPEIEEMFDEFDDFDDEEFEEYLRLKKKFEEELEKDKSKNSKKDKSKFKKILLIAGGTLAATLTGIGIYKTIKAGKEFEEEYLRELEAQKNVIDGISRDISESQRELAIEDRNDSDLSSFSDNVINTEIRNDKEVVSENVSDI